MDVMRAECFSDVPALSLMKILLRVFGDSASGATGNLCEVITAADGRVSATDCTRCYLQPLSGVVWEAHCISPEGLPIQCCGHGLLAGAAIAMGERHQAVLINQGLPIYAHRDPSLFWLRFPRLHAVSCPIPDWSRDFFQEPPIRAAIAGGSDGYWILQWPDDFPLQTLQLSEPGLTALTSRALIVTVAARHGKAACNETIRYRYFAPQYNSREDPATGSAMRVLADYWGHRQMTALQCSPGGGVLYSRLTPRRAMVGGQVQQVTSFEKGSHPPAG